MSSKHTLKGPAFPSFGAPPTVYSPQHPRVLNNNRVFEHIIIAEKKYGRLISKRICYNLEMDEHQKRKDTPIFSGVLNYFPDAIREMARVSRAGNDQHNKGEPLHWAREKSTDHLDCCARHLTDHAQNPMDIDGQRDP